MLLRCLCCRMLPLLSCLCRVSWSHPKRPPDFPLFGSGSLSFLVAGACGWLLFDKRVYVYLSVCVSVCVGHVFPHWSNYYLLLLLPRRWCWAGEQVLIVRVEFVSGSSPSLSLAFGLCLFFNIFSYFWGLPLVIWRWIKLLAAFWRASNAWGVEVVSWKFKEIISRSCLWINKLSSNLFISF